MDYLKGTGGEVPLRVKMTALLRLLDNRSLFQDRERWEQLSASYGVRNRIIHEGSAATEEHASNAIEVARWVVAFMADDGAG